MGEHRESNLVVQCVLLSWWDMSDDPCTLPGILRRLEFLDREGQDAIWVRSVHQSRYTNTKATVQQTH